MPYYIKQGVVGCSGWATIKDDGETIGCHQSKADAIAQMVAVSLEEGIEPGGERELPDNYRPSLSEDVPVGRACGNCAFYDETMTEEQQGGLVAYCHRWDDFVRGDFYCNAWQEAEHSEEEPEEEPELIEEESRQVDLSPPKYMRSAARRGLELYADGEAGEGLQPATVREARLMAQGEVSEAKWRRIGPWIARHIGDLDAVDEETPITPGLVAHLLWGSGPSKAAAERAQQYAEGVVARLDAEQDRSFNVGKRVKEIEMMRTKTEVETRRLVVQDFEIRQEGDGMTFRGYAAVFNSDSEPLPFIERIMPGAFDKTLKSRNNVKMYLNHDSTLVLGSTRAKTLRLTVDGKGLLADADLPNTSYARDLAELMKRGDVDSMSFGFSVPRNGDSWSEDGMRRELREVRLHEVSVVTGFPAYKATSASLRSIDALAEVTGLDADKLAEALTVLENGKTLSLDHAAMLEETINKLRAQPEPDAAATLALKLKQLDLLSKQF